LNRVYVNPKNDNIVYCLNVELERSLDGGKTFSVLPSAHGDNQDLWIDPQDGKRLILADDGGARSVRWLWPGLQRKIKVRDNQLTKNQATKEEGLCPKHGPEKGFRWNCR